MRLVAGALRVSASDLTSHLACEHLTTLRLAVERQEIAKPYIDDPHAQLLFAKGRAHEDAYRVRLIAAGRRVLGMPEYEHDSFDATEARRLTEDALRTGEADVIYQAYLADDPWRGFADFLERREDGGYEPVDTKLSRSSKPAHLLQLCFYAEQVERITGRLPEHVHVELGTGVRESHRTADAMAYYRRARARFLGAVEQTVASEGPILESAGTYPWPCQHCGICDFRRICKAKLEADDNPVLVAGLGRRFVDPLSAAGIHTLAELGAAAPDLEVAGIRTETLAGLRHQAELQLHHRTTGEHRAEKLPLEPERGFDLLPPPSAGDVYLDLEGHPFFEPARSLEYLFGWCWRESDGEARYRAAWGLGRDGEKRILEEFVDWLEERRRQHPDLHVYHYASYERSALRRLMGEHGTREHEVDGFLREEVLVDLYRVTRQALRLSTDSYSIKAVEKVYGFQRTADVHGGDESTVNFERYLETGEQSLLRDVEAYNEEDCRSTVALHDWLLSLRPPGLPWRAPPSERARSEAAEEMDAARAAVRDALLARGPEGGPDWLLAQLLDYHRREAKPQWWEYFNRLTMTEEELIDDSNCLGGLVFESKDESGQSYAYTFTYPDQEHRIDGDCVDPANGKGYHAAVDVERGTVLIRRRKNREDEPLPRALIPPGPITNTQHREAILRLADARLAGEGSHPALTAILERRPPHTSPGTDVVVAALALDEDYLFVQGPPGAGKTWQGAQATIALMRAGKRVGVVSLSHKAILNFLRAVEHEAERQGFRFRGRKKHTDEDDAFKGPNIDSSDDNADLLDPDLQLLAGTSWLFARSEFVGHLDVLFVDEAGQLSLADTLAAGRSARNLVLLGDPNQLPQVSQGAQPEEAKASVLTHLLGNATTVSPERGIFLAETWRLRPELCAFTSDAYYDGRLAAAPAGARRTLTGEDGLALALVSHEARSQASPEEAEAVASEIDRLAGTLYRDEQGNERALRYSDVLVVAPYNMQVRALRRHLPAEVRIGTVDKFQGQEAPVVIVSFASSSSADAPRGIGFAFDRHRVNVATSRGQCRVVVVCAPRLLDADCRSIEEIRLVNAVCRFAELAGAPLR
ncbi:MAG: TM0106 family RecB-like putative nuclease [Gaiella sp.]